MSGWRWRIFGVTASISVGLVALCVSTAVSLFMQQQAVASLLRDNIATRRAAVELEECLQDLLTLERHDVEAVASLHERVQKHLEEVRTLADELDEQVQYQQIAQGFAEYLRQWQSMPPVTDPEHRAVFETVRHFLEHQVLRPSIAFREAAGQRLEQATQHHESMLRRLAWGMAGIGLLGGGAGLILGYGVARGVSRTIRRLQVQLRDATGKLDPHQAAEIVLTEEAAFGSLHQQLDQLTERIEQMVERLRQREHEVLRAEQLAAVGQLAAGVGHELRNPLTSIKMLVQTGLENGGSLAAEDLIVMEDAIRRMERALQTFLDFARPPKLERQATDICRLLPTALQLIRGRAAKQHVELRWEAPTESIPAIVDAEQVQQVLINLLLNALDAMPHGGRLTLRLQADPQHVLLEIEDTGPGIPPEHMPRLFEPFFSTKTTGLGLGLVICRRIVEDHGGTLEIANRPEGGVRCRVILPRSDTESTADVVSARAVAPVAAGR